jgi:transcriptional regulator with XRE-family HTH domain
MIYNELKPAKKVENFLFLQSKMDKLKENILWYRKQRKWSQEKMGAIYDLTRENIASYERGLAKPGINMLSEICRDLKMYLHDFINEDMATYKNNHVALTSMVNEEAAPFISTKDVLIENLQQQIKDKDKIITLLEKQLNHKP